MNEVSRPIIAITLVLCAVFVPVAFVSGLTGEFYRQFALTIAISAVISAFNSLTLSPALAAALLKPQHEQTDWLSRVMRKVLRPAVRRVQPRLRAHQQCVLEGYVEHRSPQRHRSRGVRRPDRAHLARLQHGAGRVHSVRRTSSTSSR